MQTFDIQVAEVGTLRTDSPYVQAISACLVRQADVLKNISHALNVDEQYGRSFMPERISEVVENDLLGSLLAIR